MSQSWKIGFASYVLLLALVLSGCSPWGGVSSAPVPASGPDNTSYYVGGAISGLNAAGLVLRNNGTDDLAIAADGIFFFATPLSTGTAFSITILSQPSGQLCSLTNGSGTVGTVNALGASVTCLSQPAAPTFHYVGGTISGLNAAGLVLRNNGVDDLAIAADGVFFFATPLVTGTAYSISIYSQPSGQLCTLANGSGTVSNANALGASVTCLSQPAAPTLNLGFTIKQLQFTWAASAGATHYKLYQNPDGVSGFTQLGGDIAVGTTQYLHDIAVHRHNWAGARYLLEACNAAGCTQSNSVDTLGAVLQAIGYFKASNTASNDYFGYALALSADGNTLAVGAYQEDSNATGIDGNQADDSAADAGAVYVFSRIAGTWSQQAYLKASNTGAGDRFGFSLALSADGNSLAVGAYQEDSNTIGIDGNQANDLAGNSGAVYVFSRAGSTWSQQAYVKASNTAASDNFGFSLALSGDGNTLAVGAYNEDSNATGINGNQANNSAGGSGAVYVFARSGVTWTQESYVKASNTGGSDNFGYRVALNGDGNTLAVGAHNEDSNATGIDGNQADNSAVGSGAVYVYLRTGGTWSQQAYVKASNAAASDFFGFSLALSADGNTLAVGAYQEDSNATGIDGNQADNSAVGSGAVYVYLRTGGTWNQQAYVKASNAAASDFFGYTVTLSGDGNTLAIGAYNEDSNATGVDGDQINNSAGNAGAVYTFVRAVGAWTQQTYVKSSNTAGSDFFGFALGVSADGNTIAIGAYGEDSNATGINGTQSNNSASAAGAVYLY